MLAEWKKIKPKKRPGRPKKTEKPEKKQNAAGQDFCMRNMFDVIHEKSSRVVTPLFM